MELVACLLGNLGRTRTLNELYHNPTDNQRIINGYPTDRMILTVVPTPKPAATSPPHCRRLGHHHYCHCLLLATFAAATFSSPPTPATPPPCRLCHRHLFAVTASASLSLPCHRLLLGAFATATSSSSPAPPPSPHH